MPRKEDVEFVMVHALATPFGWRMNESVQSVVEEVRRWHVQERGWSDIAYAEVIHFNGRRGRGRDLNKNGNVWDDIGAGAKGWNKNCIHIALNGGKGSSADDLFGDHFTVEQDEALRNAIHDVFDWLGREVPVIGHNDVAAKACPGFDAKRWWKGQPKRKLTESTTMQAAGGGAAATVAAGGTALGALEGDAQIVALVAIAVALLAFLWIARERVKKWAKGVH